MQITNGAVILKPGFELAQQVKEAIPHAAQGLIAGETAIAVKHKLTETLILRNLGFDIPSPIGFGWKWPGMHAPRENQRHTSAFATLYRRAFIFNEMRTGKSMAALWASEYLLQEGFIRRVLIVCPKSCMHAVWSEALFQCLPHRSVATLYGSKETRLKALAKGTEFCIINHDGITALATQEKKKIECKVFKDKFDLIIYDEGDVLCNHRTKLYKAFASLLSSTTWLWLMTGTPVPNQYADAWGLLKLVCNKLPCTSWTQFREMMMYKATQYKWLNRDGAKELLFQLMQPAIRFTQAECFDLPAVQEIWRTAELSPEQKKLYWQMQKNSKLDREKEEVQVIAANAAVRLAKMLQISSGAVKDEDGNKISVDASPRLETLGEVLHESGVVPRDSTLVESKKAVLFMPYKYAMEDVKVHLEKQGYRCALVNGDVPEWKRRDDIFPGFRGTHPSISRYDVLIAHPETTAHGLDLTCAETVIWYAPCFGNRLYEQGNMRHQGEKQKGTPAVVHITCTALERERFAALKKGVLNQAMLLEMYERAVEEEI